VNETHRIILQCISFGIYIFVDLNNTCKMESVNIPT